MFSIVQILIKSIKVVPSVDESLLVSSDRPAIPGGPQSLLEIFSNALLECPDHIALVSEQSTFTISELDQEIRLAATALIELGLKAGDRIAASLPNRSDIVIAFFASMRLGLVWVGINQQLSEREKAYILSDSGAVAYLAARKEIEAIRLAQADLPALHYKLDVEPGDDTCGWRRLLSRANPGRDLPQWVNPYAPAAIAYTSGTTGSPKGVVHSQRNLIVPAVAARDVMGLEPTTTIGVYLPLTLPNLLVLGPILAAVSRATCVLIDSRDPAEIAKITKREKIVSLRGVPTTFYDLLTREDIPEGSLDSLTKAGVGGVACPENLKALFREKLGQEPQNSYGLTEAPTFVTMTDPQVVPVAGSSGIPFPHIQVDIKDDNGRTLAPGETGEVCIGPRSEGPWAGVYTTMLGYWQRPDATREALQDGIVRTGDIGYLNNNGELFIVDRKSSMIIRGGANVYPVEVESVLRTEPSVLECVVVGMSDDRLGERVAAVIQLKPGCDADERALKNHCKQNLAKYKAPEKFVFVENLPRNAMNKVLRKDIKTMIESLPH